MLKSIAMKGENEKKKFTLFTHISIIDGDVHILTLKSGCEKKTCEIVDT